MDLPRLSVLVIDDEQALREVLGLRIGGWGHEVRTVPVAIALITGASRYELPWGSLMAASVIVTLPLIVLVLIFQRRIVAGLTAGALKG